MRVVPMNPVVEVDPLSSHAEFGQRLVLGGEFLLIGGAAGVADDRLARGRLAYGLAPDDRNFHRTGQLQRRRSRPRHAGRCVDGCS